MTQPKSSTRSITLTHTCALLYQEIDAGLSAYRITRSAEGSNGDVPKAFQSHLGVYIIEALAPTNSVVAFAEGRETYITNLEGNFTVVDEAFLENARTTGFRAATELLTRREDVYTALVEEGVSPDRLVQVDYGNHLLHDRHNAVLPVARYFSYMHGHIHNGRYDLSKALETLRSLEAVRFVPHEGGDHGPFDKILAIPYYNRSAAHSAHLSFWFSPTREQELAIRKEQENYPHPYATAQWHRAVDALDLLGLRAAGARLPDKEEDD